MNPANSIVAKVAKANEGKAENERIGYWDVAPVELGIPVIKAQNKAWAKHEKYLAKLEARKERDNV